MSRKLWIALIVGLVVVGGVVVAASLAGRGVQVPQFVTAEAGPGQVVLTVTGSGAVQPADYQTVRARASGEVDSISVDSGERVDGGQELARLCSEDLNYRIRSAEMDLESARLNLLDLLGLGPRDPIPPQVASAIVEVVAPTRGRILGVDVDQGDRVNDGNILFRIVSDEVVEFEFELAPDYADLLSEGDAVAVHLRDFDDTVDGRIEAISMGTNIEGQSPGTTVSVSLENPVGLIRPGMKGHVTAHAADQTVVRPGEIGEFPVISVRASRSGVVDVIEVSEGQTVENGEVLCSIGTSSHSLQVRQQMLRISQAELSIDRYRSELEHLVISSPMTGEVTEVFVNEGDTVSTGAQILTISSQDEFEVQIDVDELEIASLSPGMDAEISLDALPGLELRGVVDEVARSGDVRNGVTTYRVVVSVASGAGMRNGMSADVTIEVDRREQVLSVPAEAVTTAEGVSSVRVVTPEGAEERTVAVGLTDGVRTEILDGLSEGDEVVISSIERDTMFFMGPGGG